MITGQYCLLTMLSCYSKEYGRQKEEIAKTDCLNLGVNETGPKGDARNWTEEDEKTGLENKVKSI